MDGSRSKRRSKSWLTHTSFTTCSSQYCLGGYWRESREYAAVPIVQHLLSVCVCPPAEDLSNLAGLVVHLILHEILFPQIDAATYSAADSKHNSLP